MSMNIELHACPIVKDLTTSLIVVAKSVAEMKNISLQKKFRDNYFYIKQKAIV